MICINQLSSSFNQNMKFHSQPNKCAIGPVKEKNSIKLRLFSFSSV